MKGAMVLGSSSVVLSVNIFFIISCELAMHDG
jgi:hypothetical protein